MSSKRKRAEPEYALHLGDALSSETGMARLPKGKVDLVLCDPPFGVTSRNKWDKELDLDAVFAQLERVTKPNAAVIFFSQGILTAKLMLGPWQKHYRYSTILKYNKPRGFLNAKKQPLRYHSDIVVFYRKQCTYNPQMVQTDRPVHACKRKATSVNYGHAQGGTNTRAGATDRYPGSVIEFGVVDGNDPDRFHPTQKPVDLCEYLIRAYSNEGDLVLDFCAGSATTGVAALQTGRRFVGFEKEAEYHEKASARLQATSDRIAGDADGDHAKSPRKEPDITQS